MNEALRRLGEKIRKLRKGRGWSQFELMYQSGVGKNTISAIENGKCASGIDVFWTLANALGTPLEKIIKGITPYNSTGDLNGLEKPSPAGSSEAKKHPRK